MNIAQQLVARLADVLTPQATSRLGGYTPRAFARAIAKRINRDRETMPQLSSILLELGPVCAALNDTSLRDGAAAVLKAITCMIESNALMIVTEGDHQHVTWSEDTWDWMEKQPSLRFGEPMLEEPTEHAIGVDGGNARNSISRRPATMLSDVVEGAMNIVQAVPYTLDQRVLAVMREASDLLDTSVEKVLREAERIGINVYWLPVFVDWRVLC